MIDNDRTILKLYKFFQYKYFLVDRCQFNVINFNKN